MKTKAIATFLTVVYHSSIFLLSLALINIVTHWKISIISAISASSQSTRLIANLTDANNKLEVQPQAHESFKLVLFSVGAFGTQGKELVFWFQKSGQAAEAYSKNENCINQHKSTNAHKINLFII